MSGGSFVSINQTQNIMGSQPSSHYHGSSPNYGSPHTSSFQHISPSSMKVNSAVVGSKVMNQGYGRTSYGDMSPGGNADGTGVKIEERSPYSVQNNSPYSKSNLRLHVVCNICTYINLVCNSFFCFVLI